MNESFVIDNSVVMTWCFKDEANQYADSILGSPYKTVQVIISIGYILCLRQYTAKNQALTK